MSQKRVLVVGATGYLGKHLVSELLKQDYSVRVLIRKESQKSLFKDVEYLIGEATKASSLNHIAENIDIVISSLGITRQKDGLTYMDVDYRANANILKESIKSKVQKFLYVSAINGDKLRQLKIFEAKEKFVDELKVSGLDYTILRPNGFFSDMRDFLDMAKNGRVFLFGNGEKKLNPIHGEDLAKVCIEEIDSSTKELSIGGPDVLSQNDIARLALEAWNKPEKIVHLPDWIRKVTITLLRTFTGSKTYGPIEFFLTAMAYDNIANCYGERSLENFFKSEVFSIHNSNK